MTKRRNRIYSDRRRFTLRLENALCERVEKTVPPRMSMTGYLHQLIEQGLCEEERARERPLATEKFLAYVRDTPLGARISVAALRKMAGRFVKDRRTMDKMIEAAVEAALLKGAPLMAGAHQDGRMKRFAAEYIRVEPA